MRVLMIGVDSKRVGGMWTVAENYLSDEKFCKETNLEYIATSTNGSKLIRIQSMLKGYTKIIKRLKNDNIDIVHVHMAEKGSTFRKGTVVWLAKLFKAKTVIHLHAGPFMAWYGTLKKSNQDKIKKIFDMADEVIVLGEFWKKEMCTLIPDSKITVIYNGIIPLNSNVFDIKAHDIVYFGVLKKEKGIYDLIKAVKVIDNVLPKNVKIKLCGTDLEGDIESTIRESGLQNRIFLLGWVNSEQRDSILRKAAISVLPSYYEGLSMTIIEAMSYGVPVLTTDISTMREVLGDEIELTKAGDVDALAEQLLKLSSNEELRKRWSSIEYERACNIFSLENNIENTYQIYCDLLK